MENFGLDRYTIIVHFIFQCAPHVVLPALPYGLAVVKCLSSGEFLQIVADQTGGSNHDATPLHPTHLFHPGEIKRRRHIKKPGYLKKVHNTHKPDSMLEKLPLQQEQPDLIQLVRRPGPWQELSQSLARRLQKFPVESFQHVCC